MALTLDSSYQRIPIDELPLGRPLKGPVYDDNSDILLVAAGTMLTKTVQTALRRRGISHVRIGSQDLRPSRNSRSRIMTAPREEEEPPASRWSNGKPPFLKLHTKTMSNPGKSPLVDKFTEQLSQSVVRAGEVFTSLAKGQLVSSNMVMEMIQSCRAQLTEDIDLFVALGAGANTDQYPISHSLQTARLAMAIAAVMGVDQSSLMDIGAGCVLHDVGMLRVAPELLNTERPLDIIEKLDVTKHPAYSFEMLKNVPDLPVGARMIAYQMHERLDGSGYPRKVGGPLIHVYSRIAMVADTFVAMTSPRPHRAEILPHYVMLEILEEAAAGRFDRAVIKGLLDTVSMFPLGSHVELSNGNVGNVLRANPGCYTRPIIESWNPATPEQKEIVDLKERLDLEVVRPLYGTG